MIQLIKADLYRYVPKRFSILNFLIGMRAPGFRYLVFKRLDDAAKRTNPFKVIIKLLRRHYMYKYGFQMGGKIGKGLFIGHFGTIVVNPDAIIGENCNIAHGVTIGVTRRGSRKGVPTIGNHVWIGTGAVIVGKISVGNNVLIAPGAYVNFDVPDNSVVIGNPGIVKENINATLGYINNVLIE